ncbi:MAG: RNA-binding protein [Thermoprotei archaeon]|nr:MAG: RNA-binding protein [Thermoprotei archaeon]
MPVYAKNRQIVVPGELIAETNRYEVEGKIYRKNKKIYSKVLGVVFIDEEKRNIRVLPLKGKYIPNEGDIVIGKVIEVGLTNWTVDINSPYLAVLQVTEVFSKPTQISRTELSKILDVGDIIIAKVISFDYTRDPLLTIKESRLGKVSRGIIVEIPPSKVPRIIGKKGSMVNMLKNMLDVEIVIGKNGRVVVIGKDPAKEEIAVLAIKKIEREAHTSGLTDRVKAFIEEKLKELGEKS